MRVQVTSANRTDRAYRSGRPLLTLLSSGLRPRARVLGCELARASAGQHVLIHGPSGAIGSAAVQLLGAMGMRVTTGGLPEHRGLAGSLGAEEVLGVGEPFPVDVPRFAAVLDAAGNSSFGHHRRALERCGVYTSSELGRFRQRLVLAAVAPLSRGRRVVLPVPMEGREAVRHLRDRQAAGDLWPVSDRVYPLAEIVEAHRHVEGGTKVGNVLVRVAEGE